ncbi:hypothetical protein NE237_006873 [Protea cynaroides]|uniref:Uncharacterized protein n=1 Tax=Protea cynaroides TaxID=273540 RepID=A0A9Q0KNG2_9MAGN|nr:hypothetical protein NE237_006873 [Protea cynaroides]
MLAKRNKAARKASDDASSGPIEEEAKSMHYSGKPNEECVHMDSSQNESSSISAEPFETTKHKGPEEPKPLRVLEALAASGLRALQNARKVEGTDKVVALDIDKGEVEGIDKVVALDIDKE